MREAEEGRRREEGGMREEGREDREGDGGGKRGKEEGREEGGGEGGGRRGGRREEGGEAGGYSLNHQCFECQAWGACPQQKAQEIRKVGSLLSKWLGGNLIKVRERKRRERRRLK